jgi:peptide deformylase
MIKALNNEDDGVAIAAPQIGESLRIFVVSKKVFDLMDEEKSKKKSKRENLDEFAKERPVYKDLVFINPVILKTSKKKEWLEEGCLSVRWLYGKVERPVKTLVKAYDEEGKVFSMGGSGILSQVFQHEIDHLNGTLFIDKASDLKEIPPATHSDGN